MKTSLRWLIVALMGVMTGFLFSLAGEARVSAPGGKPVTFCLQKGDAYVEISTREVSPKEDQAYWSQPVKGKTERDIFMQDEDKLYQDIFLGVPFARVKDHTVINGYNIGKNQPTWRQYCAGLALARLLKGPFPISAEGAYEAVKKITEPVNSAQVNDVVVYFSGTTPKHFALVASVSSETPDPEITKNRPLKTRINIYSKDTQETVRHGDIDGFPLDKNYKSYGLFRLDWNQIEVYRKGDLTVEVLEEKSKKAVKGATVQTILKKPVNRKTQWGEETTNNSGQAQFTAAKQKDFPFALDQYNLTLKVVHPKYETKEQPVAEGPYYPKDGAKQVKVYLNPCKVEGQWEEKNLKTGKTRTVTISRQGSTITLNNGKFTYTGSEKDGQLQLKFLIRKDQDLFFRDLSKDVPQEVKQQILAKNPENVYSMKVVSCEEMTGKKCEGYYFEWSEKGPKLVTLRPDPCEEVVWKKLP